MCEKCKLDGYFWENPSHRQRVTRKEAQKILLNHETIISVGKLREVKARPIGAGVYEIYLTLCTRER